MRKIILLLLFILPSSLFAQEECAFILEEAQDMFDAGLIESIPDKLANCLDHGFTSEEKVQAYKLVILSYIFDDDYVNADLLMLEFLKDYPAYQPAATDPVEFVAIMDSYDTRPIFMLGGRIGTSFSFPMVTAGLDVYSNNDHSGYYTPGGARFQGAFRFEKLLSNNISFSGEFVFANTSFDYYLDDEESRSVSSAEISDFSIISYYETQNSILLPIGISYFLGERDFKPYFSFGIAPGLLLSATADGTREYVDDIGLSPINVANVGLLDVRKRINFWTYVGAGFKYKAGPGELFLDARVSLNLSNQIPQGVDLYIDELAYKLLYVNDYFILNRLTISAGYMFPIYNPKKKVQ